MKKNDAGKIARGKQTKVGEESLILERVVM